MIPLLITATVTRPVICPMGNPNLASLLTWARADELSMHTTRDDVEVIDILLWLPEVFHDAH